MLLDGIDVAPEKVLQMTRCKCSSSQFKTKDVAVSKLELTALNFVDVKIVKTKKIWKRVNLKIKMIWSITKKKKILLLKYNVLKNLKNLNLFLFF